MTVERRVPANARSGDVNVSFALHEKAAGDRGLTRDAGTMHVFRVVVPAVYMQLIERSEEECMGVSKGPATISAGLFRPRNARGSPCCS